MLIKHLPAAALLAAFAVTAPPSALANDDNDLRDFVRWRGCGDSPLSELTRTLDVIGLTKDQRLICFNEKRPGWARNIGHVSGLHTDTALVGIDFRVQDGKLYGVGNNGGVYLLDTDHAAATLVNRLTVALDGTSFGVDFNPAADRLRIVSNTGQNLRHNVNAGGVTIADDPLDYPTTLNGIGPTALGINGSAYTNNDLDANTATTLYALDTNLDQIALQVAAERRHAVGHRQAHGRCRRRQRLRHLQHRAQWRHRRRAGVGLTDDGGRQERAVQHQAADRQGDAARLVQQREPGHRHRDPAEPVVS